MIIKNKKDFADFIVTERYNGIEGKTEERWLSQIKLCEFAKNKDISLTQEQLSDYETGKKTPSIKKIIELAYLLNVDLHIEFKEKDKNGI